MGVDDEARREMDVLDLRATIIAYEGESLPASTGIRLVSIAMGIDLEKRPSRVVGEYDGQ